MEITKHVVKDQRDITIRDLRDRVAELEAAQVPRPMGTAPRDRIILAAVPDYGWCEVKYQPSGDLWVVVMDDEIPDMPCCWVPLPGE